MTARTSSCERRLALRNELSELDQLRAFTRDVGRDAGLNKDQIFALELCLEEAVANIIIHGCSANHVDEHIWVSIARDTPSVVACLEDDGFPFDPTAVAAPASPDSLEDARVGGLGVHLIRQLTTNMRYERVAGRNRLILEFGPKAEAPA